MPLSIDSAWRHLEGSEVASCIRADLLELIPPLFERWSAWGEDRELHSFVNHRRLLDEVEEGLVPLSKLLDHLEKLEADQVQAPDGEGEERTVENGALPVCFSVYDLCAGKGFFSMLLAGVAQHPLLRRWVKEVVMLDRSGRGQTVELAHVEASNRCPDFLPIRFVQANVHDDRIDQLMGLTPLTRAIFVGVHLCKTLSPRVVEMFSRIDRVDVLILSPCCVPLTGSPVLLETKSVDPKFLRSLDQGGPAYAFWVDFLLSALPADAHSQVCNVRIAIKALSAGLT